MLTKPAVSRAKAYLKVRHKAVRDAMKDLQLDAILLTHAPDIAYLSNFSGEDSIGLITHKDIFLVTDFRYQEQVEKDAGWLKASIRDGKMEDTLATVIAASGATRIGFEANFTTVGQIDATERAVKALVDKNEAKPIEMVGLQDVLRTIRKVKDDHEIDLIRKSVGLAEEAFNAIRSEIKPGQTENYLAGLMILELRSRGASDSSFPVIVAAGPNSSLPHYRPGEVTLLQDQPCLFDWGAMLKGYASDLTRTMVMGRVSARYRQAYKAVYEAQQAAFKFLRPGVTTQQADRVARDVIEEAGFGKEFGHGLGHGIGREIHEPPFMRKNGNDEELRPGMIITVEPGIYLPGEGGVRIEDDVLITHSGCEVLSTLDRTFEGNHLE